MAYDRGANRSGGAAARADLPLDKEPRKAALPLAEGGFCRSLCCLMAAISRILSAASRQVTGVCCAQLGVGGMGIGCNGLF